MLSEIRHLLVLRPAERRENGKLTYFGYVIEDPVTGRIVLQHGREVSDETTQDKQEMERLQRHLLRETLKKAPPMPRGAIVFSGVPIKHLL